MSVIERAIELIKAQKKKIEEGGINCIPISFPRFSRELPGIEQRTYFQVTAYTKVGKSQITDKLFVYDPIFFAYQNRDKLRIRIFYFTWEMSKEKKALQVLSHVLYRIKKIHKSPKDLRSVRADEPISENVIQTLESDDLKEFYQFFEDRVEFIDDIRNPFGVYKFMKDYATANGTQHKKSLEIKDKLTGKITVTEIDDYYEPYDKDEYVIIIMDHLALLSPENGKSLRETMAKMSEYCITLRNKYNYIPVAVIQQAMDKESNETFKLGRLRPSIDGYGDAKTVARDADITLGLFSPFKYGIDKYEGYNIKKFGDYIRFLEIIVGREGGGGSLCPLYFDGATNTFEELPLPDDTTALEKVYNYIKKLNSPESATVMLLHKIKTIFKTN